MRRFLRAPARTLGHSAAVSLLRLKLILAYDGTAYHGWQAQRSGRGVQNRLEEALARLFPGASAVESASRTDTGVHALGLAVHFDVPRADFRMPLRHLPLALNAGLPEDIRVLTASRAAADFHARFSATGKQYRYRIWNHPAMNPLLRHHAWHVPRPLDLAAMQRAAAHFIGRHDFRSFTARREGVLGDPLRTLTRCEIRRSAGTAGLTFLFEAEGFLYKMCRAIAGTLVQIGEGRFAAEDVPAMLQRHQRAAAGVNAPAHGLVLQKVFYPKFQNGKNGSHGF